MTAHYVIYRLAITRFVTSKKTFFFQIAPIRPGFGGFNETFFFHKVSKSNFRPKMAKNEVSYKIRILFKV